MTLPQTRERRPHAVGAAPWKSYDGDETRIPTASAHGTVAAPWARALALSPSAPSCPCGDYARALADAAPMVWAEAYAAGYRDGAGEGPAHPAVVDSVARMFAPWDGPDAAHVRSVTRFRTWHAQARAELKEAA